jgi:hypothetical protein
MSCANETCSSTRVDLQSSPSLADYSSCVLTTNHSLATADAGIETETSPEQSRFELTANKSKTRYKIRPQGAPDAMHRDPESIWGDEGPLNE